MLDLAMSALIGMLCAAVGLLLGYYLGRRFINSEIERRNRDDDKK